MKSAAYWVGFLLVVLTLGSCEIIVTAMRHAEPDPKPTPEPELTLPQKCAQYYDDGSDRWIDCMGVGKR